MTVDTQSPAMNKPTDAPDDGTPLSECVTCGFPALVKTVSRHSCAMVLKGRLEAAHENNRILQATVESKRTLLASAEQAIADAHAGLSAQARELADAYAEKARLARDIDVAMHGESDAAPQSSLCDLVPLAKRLRDRAEAAEQKLAEVERELTKTRNSAVIANSVAVSSMRRAEAAEQEAAQLRADAAETLKDIKRIAAEAHFEWDADNDMRVGKILGALAGYMPGYRAGIDALHDRLRGAALPSPAAQQTDTHE